MKADESVFEISDILRAVAGSMETPVVVILILLMAAAVFLLGCFTLLVLGAAWGTGLGIFHRKEKRR